MLELDKDKDGSLTAEEFKPKWDALASDPLLGLKNWLAEVKEKEGVSSDEVMTEVITHGFDKDGNGNLDLTELKRMQKWWSLVGQDI